MMLAKIFLKEWRENSLIFFLAVLMILALALLNLSDQRAWTLYFAGMLLWLFLPFAGMLLGSGAFYSEFKDNAWIYLFSRPVRRESIWIIKYLSSLSVLMIVYLIFLAVMRYMPGLAEILEDITPPTELTSPAIAIMAFTIAFSMSILYEKQFIIIFITVLIGISLGLLFQQYLLFLYKNYFYYKDLGIFPVLIAISFLMASLLTFIKADFSQPLHKVSLFLRYIVIFIVLVFVICTLWVSKGRVFTSYKDFDMQDSQIHNSNVYFDSYFQGFLRYNSQLDKMEKIGSKFEVASFNYSIHNEQIAFYKEKDIKGKGYDDLWIMNTDGSEERALTESYKLDSPFHSLRLECCEFSPDGNRVAFITQTPQRKSQDVPKVWTINLDGTEAQNQPLLFPGNRGFHILAWLDYENSLIIWIDSSSHKVKQPVIKLSLETGEAEILVEHIGSEFHTYVSPLKNYLAFRTFQNKENEFVTSLLNLRTGEQKVIFSSDLAIHYIHYIKWGPNEERFVFWAKREIWIYDLLSERLQKIQSQNKLTHTFDWVYGGQKLVITELNNNELYLRLLDENFNEEKRIELPEPVIKFYYLKGLNKVVLLRNHRRGSLWRLNLETENVKKIY